MEKLASWIARAYKAEPLLIKGAFSVIMAIAAKYGADMDFTETLLGLLGVTVVASRFEVTSPKTIEQKYVPKP